MMTEKIRIALIKHNMSVKDLAASIGCTSQNLSGKFKRDNFSEKSWPKLQMRWDIDSRVSLLIKKPGKRSKHRNKCSIYDDF